ncbi:MAG: succinyl-diaminopimelate desuccinylase [Alcanivoracaceae bacterium]|nr:succinyl-diaminopimelate desuccinylase [Alcanivoracaceae bacterium]
MSESQVIQLAKKLIEIDSITPNDKGCQILITDLLTQAGFQIEHKRFGKVDNLFAWHGSNDGKSLMFLGHTDVVPTGDENSWKYPPFSASIDDGYLYGRGAADMKSSVAAFTLAMIEFVKKKPNHLGKIALMLTSDDEGIALDGVKKMMPYITPKHAFDYCLVGEPSSSEQLGDVARIGRRGSLHVNISIHGKQGHVAYPENASNPIFLAAQFIDYLSSFKWDEGNEDFPPTSFQISALKTSSNTSNIIPADLYIQANFRFSPESNETSLKYQLQQLLDKYNLNYTLKWNLSGRPFHSRNKMLKNALADSIFDICHRNVMFNTAGGTSDGRFVAPHGVEVVELGVVNKTIHQIDEKVLITDVEKLQNIYYQIITTLLNRNT